MRWFVFVLGALLFLGIPFALYKLGSPPSTAPPRMRESEIKAQEYESLQRVRVNSESMPVEEEADGR